ncbi:hypothetical protein AFL01nite_24950 [Aeromicrobium flavum]|uniref:Uncharacterized protein n=1 Tax=Aeromicrobium flavum TaxID=416568 RepID=A0A512HXI7_9ACTN|nr:hypothetical protein [Aeromicrobium flavum]GEO90168.1 hypothetical protein AFL01nite_24950 [Aeromicrobium flavum]
MSRDPGPEFLRGDFAFRTVGERREPAPWRRLFFPVLPWVLVPVMIAVQYALVDDVAADGGGDTPWGLVLMFAACVPVSFAILETIWGRFESPGIIVAFARTIALPLMMGLVLGVTASLVRLRPGVEDTIRGNRRPDGWHYWYDASRGGGDIASELPLTVLANMFMPMLVALGLVVLVVLPWFAFFRPEQFIRANMMDTSPEAAAGNAAGARALSILIILIFAVPTATVWLSNEGETGWAWVVGVAMTVVGLGLTAYVLVCQTPDHAARASLPPAFRGVQTRRHELDQESGDGGR